MRRHLLPATAVSLAAVALAAAGCGGDGGGRRRRRPAHARRDHPRPRRRGRAAGRRRRRGRGRHAGRRRPPRVPALGPPGGRHARGRPARGQRGGLRGRPRRHDRRRRGRRRHRVRRRRPRRPPRRATPTRTTATPATATSTPTSSPTPPGWPSAAEALAAELDRRGARPRHRRRSATGPPPTSAELRALDAEVEATLAPGPRRAPQAGHQPRRVRLLRRPLRVRGRRGRHPRRRRTQAAPSAGELDDLAADRRRRGRPGDLRRRLVARRTWPTRWPPRSATTSRWSRCYSESLGDPGSGARHLRRHGAHQRRPHRRAPSRDGASERSRRWSTWFTEAFEPEFMQRALLAGLLASRGHRRGRHLGGAARA